MLILVLHGWPQYELRNHFLVKFLKKQKHQVISPNLFAKEYTFTLKNSLRHVAIHLANKVPDVIIGISMGGLLVPQLAIQYPNAKVIFISSGPNLRSTSFVFNIALNFLVSPLGKGLASFLIKLPQPVLKIFYVLANPFKGNPTTKDLYLKDMQRNINFIQAIPWEKEVEIIRFVTTIDNTKILNMIVNQTLIISGTNDILMDKNQGEKLASSIKNSKLVITSGSHFNSLTEKDLPLLTNFLKGK